MTAINTQKELVDWNIKMPSFIPPKEGENPPLVIMLIEYLNSQYHFRRNIITEQVEYKSIWKEKWQLVEDELVSSLCVMAKARGANLSKDLVHDIFKSNYIKPFNPIKEYFISLPEWDGIDYIGQLAKTVQTSDDDTWNLYLQKWLVAMVRSAYFQNSVNQQMLVFFGPQGIGKTRWFMKLLPDSLKDLLFTGYTKLEDQMFQAKLSRYMLVFLDEIDTYSGKMQALIKSLITQEIVKIRPLYCAFDKVTPRIASFAAAINHEKFLSDLSGSRRYLVIDVKNIDHEHSIPMDKVFNQAFELAKDPQFQHYFDANQTKHIEEKNDQFRIKSNVEILITQCYKVCQNGEIGARPMTTTEVYYALKDKAQIPFKCSLNYIGSIMKQLGFAKTHTGTGDTKRAAWLVMDKD